MRPLQHLGLGFVEVIDTDVDMHLLGMVGIGPARRSQIMHSLERHTRPIRSVTDDDPSRVLLHALHPQQLFVEGGQRRGIGTVDHEAVSAFDHGRIVPQTADSKPVISVDLVLVLAKFAEGHLARSHARTSPSGTNSLLFTPPPDCKVDPMSGPQTRTRA